MRLLLGQFGWPSRDRTLETHTLQYDFYLFYFIITTQLEQIESDNINSTLICHVLSCKNLFFKALLSY